jgi:hypothetical protein
VNHPKKNIGGLLRNTKCEPPFLGGESENQNQFGWGNIVQEKIFFDKDQHQKYETNFVELIHSNIKINFGIK